mgnify:FL=1|tara:strand:- start:6500 stop:8110 length:1611 start_codon:yes stop_codon:yes gene_type:complete
MADWGLYQSLRGQDNWAQKRKDAQMNLQMQEALSVKEKTRNKERMEMEAKLAEYQNSVRNLDVLKKDQERIQGVEKQSRQSIVAGIAKYDGDVTKFMSSGGVMQMNEYQQSILESEEYRNAIQNKEQEANWQKDRADKTKFILSSAINREVIDPNTGKKSTKKKMMTMNEQMEAFNKGEISALNYGGSEKKVAVTAKSFKDEIKNALDPFSKDNYVTEMDVFNASTLDGASQEQARYNAKNYGNQVKEAGGDEAAWRWGAGDPLKLMQLQQQDRQFNQSLRFQKKKANAEAKATKEGSLVLDVVGNLNRKLLSGGTGTQAYMPSMGSSMLRNMSVPVSADGKATSFGAKNAYSGVAYAVNGKGENINLSNGFDVTGAPLILGSKMGGHQTFVNVNGKKYLSVTAIGESNAGWLDQVRAGLNGDSEAFNHKINDNAISGTDGTTAGSSIQLFIPVDDEFSSNYNAMVLNKEENIKNNLDGTGMLARNRDWLAQNQQMIQNLAIVNNISEEEAANLFAEQSNYNSGHGDYISAYNENK